MKEDAPIAAAMVAIVAGVETWFSSPGKPRRYRFNCPGAITLILSAFAIPVLLAISWAQSPPMYAHHSFDRIGVVAPGSFSSPGTLFIFVPSNISHWLGSSVVRQRLWVMIVGTFGTVLLRPYYLVVGVPTTGVAWLMNRNDLLWAPRFFPAEALLWCITLVGFTSIARAVPRCSKWMQARVLTAAIVIAALSVSAQLALVLWFARGAYLLRSTSHYSSSERQEADAVFGRYRREATPEEPVVAGFFFFATRMTETFSG